MQECPSVALVASVSSCFSGPRRHAEERVGVIRRLSYAGRTSHEGRTCTCRNASSRVDRSTRASFVTAEYLACATTCHVTGQSSLTVRAPDACLSCRTCAACHSQATSEGRCRPPLRADASLTAPSRTFNRLCDCDAFAAAAPVLPRCLRTPVPRLLRRAPVRACVSRLRVPTADTQRVRPLFFRRLATCSSAATRHAEVPLRRVSFGRGRLPPAHAPATPRGAFPRALSSSARAEVDAVDMPLEASGAVAAPSSAAPAAEEAALPPVDWRLVGGEATSAAGRVCSRRHGSAAAQKSVGSNAHVCHAGHHCPGELLAHLNSLARPHSHSAGAAAVAATGAVWWLIGCGARADAPSRLQAALHAAADAGAAEDVVTLTAELAYEVCTRCVLELRVASHLRVNAVRGRLKCCAWSVPCSRRCSGACLSATGLPSAASSGQRAAAWSASSCRARARR